LGNGLPSLAKLQQLYDVEFQPLEHPFRLFGAVQAGTEAKENSETSDNRGSGWKVNTQRRRVEFS
jgi:hypothetical protein